MKDLSEEELTECDKLELQFLGHIQGGGVGHVLFVTNSTAMKVVAADRHLTSLPFVGWADSGPDEVSAMLGSEASQWLPKEFLDLVQGGIKNMQREKSQRSLHFFQPDRTDDTYAVSLSPATDDYGLIGIELEAVDISDSSQEFCSMLLSFSRIMEFNADEDALRVACEAVFNLLGGYDRGMVYRMNDDYSGEVIHEIKLDHLETTYLGMRFPAGDLPKSSRELYIKNVLRYVNNASQEEEPIVSLDNQTIDLTHIRMRGVMKPHIMYMLNMGLKCSFSIAIIVDGNLWGLLAFHGYRKAFKPSLHQRIACETIASMLSVKVGAMMKSRQSSRITRLSELLVAWEKEQSITVNFERAGNEMLTVLDADAVVARVEDPNNEKDAEIMCFGDEALFPGRKFWDLFENLDKREILTASSRAALEKMGLTEADCSAGGVAFFRDGPLQLAFLRCLRAKDVAWGGNPKEPKVRSDGHLCPRNSFKKFMQKAKLESRGWSKIDDHVLKFFTDRVSEYTYNHMITVMKSSIQEANTKYFAAIERARDNCEFFAQMSHEIRTPFHGVLGCLNLLQDHESMTYEEIQDLVNTALASGNHMIHLLNDILDISKNQYAEAISRESVNYHALATEATDSLRSLAISKNIEFVTKVEQCQEQDPVIFVDRTKVVQIVANIVNNAIKFSAGGKIETRTRLVSNLKDAFDGWEAVVAKHEGSVFAMGEREFHANDEAREFVFRGALRDQRWMFISVADSGVGMKADILADMMKPYTQASKDTSTRHFQGTGLGLYICMSLCQQLEGFIGTASTEGVGSTFCIGLPVDTSLISESSKRKGSFALSHTETVATDSSSESHFMNIPLRGPVCVVDDNKVNLKILVHTLKREIKNAKIDVEILSVDGGQQAVETYKQRRPSLVFIDYHMPKIDGAEATARIRKFEKENDLFPAYIISYTADATEQTATLLKSRGTDEIMTKPPPAGYLKGIVERLRKEE